MQSLVLSTENVDQYFLVYNRNKVRYSLPAQYVQRLAPALEEYYASQKTVSGVFEGAAPPSANRGTSDAKPSEGNDQPPPYH